MDGAHVLEEDGFPAARLFNQGYSYTYDDVIFLPHYIDFPTDAVSLSTKLSRHVALATPCVASPMDTVTESSMAAAMSSLGAIGIIHSNNAASHQASLVRLTKSHKIPFTHELVFKSPSDSILSEEEFLSAPCIFVTESGTQNSKLLGTVQKSDWDKLVDKETRVLEYMRNSSVSLPASYSFEDVSGYLAKNELEFVPLVRGDEEKGDEIVNLVTGDDIERIRGFPKLGLPSLS